MPVKPIKIELDKSPTEAKLEALGARAWPVWEKPVSEFQADYDETETCLFLEGEVTVTPRGKESPVKIGPGDLVVFPKGLHCLWRVTKPVRKHYKFHGD